MADETQPITPPTSYALTDAERAFFQAVNQNATSAKLAICNLNMQLETAQKDLAKAEAQFGAGVSLLASSKGFSAPAAISPDFTRIETAKGH